MEIEEVLRKLDFTEYEARVYKALLFLISATPREISKETKVPQTRVYSILENLSRRGVISVLPGRPIRYQIIPPELGLVTIIEEKKKEMESLEEKVKTTVWNFDYKQPPQRKIAIFQGWNLIQKIIAMDVKKAKKEILRFMRFGEIDEEIFSEMEKAIKRGVEIKILGQYRKEREAVIWKYWKIGCEVKLLPFNGTVVTKESIFDGEIFHIACNEPAPTPERIIKEEGFLVRINDKPTAEFAKEKFIRLWKDAVLYSPKRKIKF